MIDKHVCPSCLKGSAENSIHCVKCDKWFHLGCVNFTLSALMLYMYSSRSYICSKCVPDVMGAIIQKAEGKFIYYSKTNL